MDQQPKIPTLKDAQKPQVKIKGMGAGLTLIDRLKQFKKKDLAFILAGLGTLFMAPLAEHFMMAPENGDAALQQGWGKGGGSGSNLFGGGSSPYENGNNNIASGGAIGGAGDIITPLNVRDPSALVMGPGAAQQPNAGSAAPSAPPPTAPARSETDYKDALAGAASRAASAAVKRSPLPVPKVALGGSGLRGLGVAGGGTSASGSLGPINSGNLGQAGTGGGGLNMIRNAPGFRGVAGARSPTGGTGLDGTKKAGANAGDAFSRAGSAMSGLNAAASEQIPTGGQGFGGGGQGGAGSNDKPGSGSGPGGSKSVGESLAFIEAKERMMENMKLEFEKRKLKDPELLLYGIRNDSLKAMASEMTKSLTKGIIGFMDPSAGGAGANYYLCGSAENGTAIKIAIDTPKCDKDNGGKSCMMSDAATPTYINSAGTPLKCQKVGDAKASPASNTEGGLASNGGNRVSAGIPDNAEGAPAATLEDYCTNLRSLKEADENPKNSVKTGAGDVLIKVDKLVAARIALYGGKGGFSGNTNTCTDKDTKNPGYEGTSVAGFVKEGIEKLDGETTNGGVFKDMLAVVGTAKSDSRFATDVEKAKTAFTKGEELRAKIAGELKGVTAADLKPKGQGFNETADMVRLRTSAEKALENLTARAGETGEKSSKVLIDGLLGLTGEKGLMLVSKQGGTLENVTGVNAKYKEASSGVEGAEIADLKDVKATLPDGAGTDASAKWSQAAEAVNGKVTAAEGPIASLKAQQDKEEKKKLLEPAKTPVQEARKLQIDMITGIRGGVQALRNPKAAPASGGAGGAVAAN